MCLVIITIIIVFDGLGDTLGLGAILLCLFVVLHSISLAKGGRNDVSMKLCSSLCPTPCATQAAKTFAPPALAGPP